MEAVIFTGIQASGKTTFYVERFLHTHVRVSLDVLRTRKRERALVEACLRADQRFVVDNTNATAAERAAYVEPAREAGFEVVSYLFEATPREAIGRNQGRPAGERIPVPGVLGTYKRLEPPSPDEGFDRLLRVRIERGRGFVVEELGASAPGQAPGRDPDRPGPRAGP